MTARITPLLLVCLLAAPGCFSFSRYKADVEENPTVDTGMGAAVIMPGQSPPVMTPGGGYAPGGNTECRQGPQGQSCSQGGTVAPHPSNVTMIGGTEQDYENHVQAKEDPLVLKWLAAPFALLAAPFTAAAEAAKGEPEPGPAVPREKTPRPEAESPPAPQDYESQRIQQMEEELARQQARQGQAAPSSAPTRAGVALPSQASQPSQGPAPPAPGRAPAGRSVSIAEELAALQRKPTTPEARREAVPEPLERAGEPRAPRPARSEAEVADGIVDRDEDGRIDLWIYRQDGQIVRKVLDQDFDGRPDTTLLYDSESHQLARVEEDGDHDGVTDGWTDYRDGQVVRRRADADHDGLADTWTFYQDGQTLRHEQDTDGDGFRDRVGFYRDGRLAREEQDTNADGVADVTSHYDAQERVTRREEDQNLDGRVDVINHYENGRLARKELLADPGTGMP